jgi:DNA-directed RNA polymerase II subunit RPB7
MFYFKKLKRDVLVEPKHLGARMKDELKIRVRRELEGQCLGKHGYVIAVLDIENADIIPGKIENDTGAVNVTVGYKAILLRPFKNEVVDAVVSMHLDMNGFFAHVGPLQIFVSKHNMPHDMHFDHVTNDCWQSEDMQIEIRENSIVRLRIIGLTIDAGVISAIGTIKEYHLGQLE